MDIRDYGITSDEQLYKIADDLNIKLNWIGYEHHLKNQPLKDGGYILNIGDDNGTHWVCFYKEGDSIFYFDSFMVPPNDELLEWGGGLDIKWNNIEEFQQLTEEMCGLWCLVALYYLQNKKGPLEERFLKMSNDI